MNEQQLQQILTIQQAIAAAATAAVINSLLNPQQAAALAAANALNEQQQPTSNDLQQPQQTDSRQSPATSSPAAPSTAEGNARIQDLLMQLQQQASLNSSQGALNLNLNAQPQLTSGLHLDSPARSPMSRLTAQELSATVAAAAAAAGATGSNISAHSITNQVSPNKKLKTRHHHLPNTPQQQQPHSFHNNNSRSSEATSKPLHSTPKNHSSIANLSRTSHSSGNQTSPSSSSAFLTNNVGLPRKLVRGQDVWLGRGAEQTRQILKCMWCGQSFRTLAEMTQHMKITQHYTNIISQEQITSWRQPDSSDSKSQLKQSANQVRNLDDNQDSFSDKLNESEGEDSFSNNEGDTLEQPKPVKHHSNKLTHSSKSERSKHNDPNSESAKPHSKNSSSTKPLTRSRRRENDTPSSENNNSCDNFKREGSSPTASTSSSQHRPNSSDGHLILSDNVDQPDRETPDAKINGDFNCEDSPTNEENDIKSEKSKKNVEDVISEATKKKKEKIQKSIENIEKIKKEEKSKVSSKEDTNDATDNDADGSANNNSDDDEIMRENPDQNDADVDDHDNDDDDDAGGRASVEDEGDNNDNDGQHSETNEATSEAATPISGSETTKLNANQKGDTGDPLSALETMVEKSFDPRLRPGVANGGILQRLGIDEEVCPPWQHINYANWYAAAAYGHPMAAALLAAGINLQNGIKLSKNSLGQKKSDD